MSWIRVVTTGEEVAFLLPDASGEKPWAVVPLAGFMEAVESAAGGDAAGALSGLEPAERLAAAPPLEKRAPMPASFAGVGAGKIGFYFDKGTVQNGEVVLTSNPVNHPGGGVDLFPEVEVGLWVCPKLGNMAVGPCIEMKHIKDGTMTHCFPGGLRTPGEFLMPASGQVDPDAVSLSLEFRHADQSVAYSVSGTPLSKLYSQEDLGKLSAGVAAELPAVEGKHFLLASGGLVKPKVGPDAQKVFLAPGDILQITLTTSGGATISFTQVVAS